MLKLKLIGKWAIPPSSHSTSPLLQNPNLQWSTLAINVSVSKLAPHLVITKQAISRTRCTAKRRVRYEDEDDDEYGHSEELARLELYSRSARAEVLFVHALVDEQEVEVLIFKGISSCLSHETSRDPSRSVLPARAVIKSIDIVKGPFDPSNLEYIEKGLSWQAFKSRLTSIAT